MALFSPVPSHLAAEDSRPCEIAPIPSSASPRIFDELLCHQHCFWNGIYCVGGEAMESYFCSNYENCFIGGRGAEGGEADRRLRRSATLLRGGVSKVTRKRTASDIQAGFFSKTK